MRAKDWKFLAAFIAKKVAGFRTCRAAMPALLHHIGNSTKPLKVLPATLFALRFMPFDCTR